MGNSEDNNRTSVSSTNMEQNIGHEPMAKEKTPRFNSLVDIRVISYRKRKHDPDGVSCKAVLDGLIREGFLLDDSTSEVNKITFKSTVIKKGEPEKTIIEIEGCEQ